MWLVMSYLCLSVVFFFKQKTAYEMRISDWSSDVCSSDLFRVECADEGSIMLKKTIALGFASLLLASPAWAAPDWSAVDRAIGRAGAEQPGGVHRYSFPRSDLSVTLDGVTIKPSLALGSWAAFQPLGAEAIVMGDLVLTHAEADPVLRSEERREGKECVSTCRLRGWPDTK